MNDTTARRKNGTAYDCDVNVLGVALLSISAIWTTACGREALPQEAAVPPERVLIAQPCPELTADNEATNGTFSDAFVQIASVTSENLPKPLGSWLVDHPVAVDQVASVMASNDKPVSVPWQHCQDGKCTVSEEWKVSVTASLPRDASEPLKLTVGLGPREGTTELARAKTIETRDQQPVVVDFPGRDGAPNASVVITPYLVNGAEYLRKMAMCKSHVPEVPKK